MTWRVATSLDRLLAEVNAAAPRRSKVSDGSIGDAAHASRTSDHNPWVTDRGVGVIRARDFTHDPAGGFDAGKLATHLAGLLGKHPALGSGAYVIWERQIVSTDRLREGWRAYAGSNPHDKHVHLSVGVRGYDSTAAWNWPPAKPPKPKPKPGLSLVHYSLRFDRSAAATRKALASLRSLVPLLTATEVQGRVDVVRADGWKVHAASDCAVTWRGDRFHMLEARSVRYETPWLMRSGAKGRPLVTPIVALADRLTGRKWVVAAVHLPASVEGNWTAKVARVVAHRAHAAQVRRAVNRLGRAHDARRRVIAGDFNLDQRRPWVRSWVRATFPRWTSAWDVKPPARGTHGSRVIDWVLVRGARVTGARVLAQTDASDHRPILVHLAERKPK